MPAMQLLPCCSNSSHVAWLITQLHGNTILSYLMVIPTLPAAITSLHGNTSHAPQLPASLQGKATKPLLLPSSMGIQAMPLLTAPHHSNPSCADANVLLWPTFPLCFCQRCHCYSPTLAIQPKLCGELSQSTFSVHQLNNNGQVTG